MFSAAKLFFAYGLGNGLTFPLAVGATAVLMAERPTPAAVFARLRKHQPTIFYGVPTLFAALLASPDLPARGDAEDARAARRPAKRCPRDIGKRWTEHFGVEILDGIGSTEMLHIFLSNRPGRRALRHQRQAGARLRAADRRRRRPPGRAGRGRRAAGQRPDRGDGLLEQPREDPQHVPGAVDAQRRQVLDRRRRLLRLRRPHRRHAQGRRHLRLAVRGRGGAGHASGRARGGGGRQARTRSSWSSRRRTSC